MTLSASRLRCAHGGSRQRGASDSNSTVWFFSALVLLTGCSTSANRYFLIEQSLAAGNPARAAAIVEQSGDEYGPNGRLLYGMDRGMALHLAGDYEQSSAVLEEAEDVVERLYTRSIRSETAAFLTSDNALPYEGDAYEHVMINVVKALNYAAREDMREALVEVRRIDHRLNVLSDKVKETDKYRSDGFARYLSGILYEAVGDLNNAFIAYRNAFEAYEVMREWSGTPIPPALRSDLLRTSEGLNLTAEFERYRQDFPHVDWKSVFDRRQLAHVVMISYNGRAPRKEDRYFDVPISVDALQLVLINRGLSSRSYHRNRAVDGVLYGLNGRVVRVALPQLVSQKTRVPFEMMTLTSEGGYSVTVRSELAHNVTALAEKSLTDRMPAITVKALARAATKFAMAEGVMRGAQQAAGRDAGPWVGLLVGLLTKGIAVMSEEADKRSWRTLPDEIHVARAWVPAGQYEAAIVPSDRSVPTVTKRHLLELAPGQTAFIIQRVMQ